MKNCYAPICGFNFGNSVGQKLYWAKFNTARNFAHWLFLITSAVLLYTADVTAASFFFSTGEPDGKVATLSRPASPGALATETADDFTLASATVITQATFTGLLVGGTVVGLMDVEVEIYRLFPNDTD